MLCIRVTDKGYMCDGQVCCNFHRMVQCYKQMLRIDWLGNVQLGVQSLVHHGRSHLKTQNSISTDSVPIV